MSPFTKKAVAGLCALLLLFAGAFLLQSAAASRDAEPGPAASTSASRPVQAASPREQETQVVSSIPHITAAPAASAVFASGTGKPGPVKSATPIHYTNKVAVLMYHDFKEDPKAKSVSAKVFAEQLGTLKANGFQFISMEQFKAFKLNRGKVPANAVLVTFDDGYEDFYTVAYPYLLKNKIPATNFIIVWSTDTGNPGGNPHLTWDQMREMTKNGMSFYSHTYDQHFYIPGSGPALTSRYPAEKGKPAETAEHYRKRIKDDLALADKRIHDELATPTDVFCYPYGANNHDLRAASIALGHKLDVTISPGLNGSDGRTVYRINAGYKSISGKTLMQTIVKYAK